MLVRKPTQSHQSQRKIKPPILGHVVNSGLSSEPICVTVSASRFPMQYTSTISASDVSSIYQLRFVFAPGEHVPPSSAIDMPFPGFLKITMVVTIHCRHIIYHHFQ